MMFQNYILIQQINIVYCSGEMSKPKIKFVYNNVQIQSEVHQMHKGPIKLQNLYVSYLQPQYQEISLSNGENKGLNSNLLPQSSYVQINKINNSPQVQSIMRHKSAESFFVKRNQEKVVPINNNYQVEPNQSNQHILKNINPKKMRQTTKLKQSQPQLQLDSQDISKIILKAPSYRYRPPNDLQQEERGVFTKKQYIKGNKNEKYLYSGIQTKKQGDFMGCFGCFDPEVKSYKANQ